MDVACKEFLWITYFSVVGYTTHMDIRRLRIKNTKEKGLLEFLVYPEKGKYIGVCLTLDIIEEGNDPAKLMESIREAAVGHVRLVMKKKLSDELLNRPALDEYWERYFKAIEYRRLREKPVGGKAVYFSSMPMPLTKRATAYA